MPKIADALERESRSVDLEHGDFERLLDRRERKQRNRRIGAGAVAVIVALATAALLVRSFQSEHVPAGRLIPPAAAPGTLAYILDGDVYVADPDGSNAVKIANGVSADDCVGHAGEYWAEGPLWSPDGRYLAYRQRDCSNSESFGSVVISDAEGNVIATFPSGAPGWKIAWSPDSTRVAVWDAFGETIGVYGLDGARQAQLTLSYLGGDVDPMWMPDATSLRVADMEVPLDGGAARYVRPRDWATCSPRSEDICSPDGSHVADVIDGSLTVGRSDGSGSRTLLTELDRGTGLSVIGFSPQGDRILYYTGDREGDGSGLWSIAVDGSHPRLLVAGASEGEWRSR